MRFGDDWRAVRTRIVLAAVLLALLCPAAAGAAQSPAEQLAAKYVPVLGIEPQPSACGSGEAYHPSRVDVLLGHPEVQLRGPDGKVVTKAPTGAELFGLGEGYYLDQPGDPLNPGCTYEKNYRAWSAGFKATVYAHVATDAAHRDKIALQFWFFYTFNDFTDKHEGDWEMAQLDFDAPTAEEALKEKHPYEVDLAQHAGGERSDWTDPKLEKRGSHPLLYVATGSHATYFSQRLYLGRGPSEGFGCDDTRDATGLIHPETEVLPEVPESASEPFPWLAFFGRWGQKEKGINNGPTGPAAKDAWSQPIEWADGLRDGSVPVPGTKTLGPSVTKFFCGAVTQGSIVLNWALVHPWAFFVLAGMLVAGSGEAVRRTTWRPVLREPLRMRRGGGQMLRAAFRVYLSDARTFLGMGAIFVPVSIVASAIQWVLFHLTGLEGLVALDGRHGAVTALLALLIGGIGAAIASVCTTAAVAAALGELDRDVRISAAEAYRRALSRWRHLAGAFVRVFGSAVLLVLIVIGIPLAIWRFIRFSFFAQACVLDGRDARGSMRRSAQLVEGQWWRTFGFTAFVDVLAALSGPFFGVLLLLLATDRSLDFIDLVGSVIYTITVPYAAIVLTLYYFDLELRRSEQPPADPPAAQERG
jgi:hypothetical protein